MNQMSSTGNYSILQTCITQPKKHIENFFKELKTQIDFSFAKIEHNDSVKENLNLINQKLQVFKDLCFQNLEKESKKDSLFSTINNDKIKKTNNEIIDDLIDRRIYLAEKEIFLNSTMFFIDFDEYKKNDLSKIYHKEIRYNQDIFGSGGKPKGLKANLLEFLIKDNAPTAGRLFYIKNFYLDKQASIILKNESLDQHPTATNNILKVRALENLLKMDITKKGLYEENTVCIELELNLDEYRTIRLENFSIRTIDQDLFNGFTNLCTLDLSYNLIESLPKGLFKDNEKLISINLSHNLLRSIDENLFSGLKCLESIDLSFNEFILLSHKVFFNLAKLNKVNLTSICNNKPEKSLNSPSSIFKGNIDISYDKSDSDFLTNNYIIGDLIRTESEDKSSVNTESLSYPKLIKTNDECVDEESISDEEQTVSEETTILDFQIKITLD